MSGVLIQSQGMRAEYHIHLSSIVLVGPCAHLYLCMKSPMWGFPTALRYQLISNVGKLLSKGISFLVY